LHRGDAGEMAYLEAMCLYRRPLSQRLLRSDWSWRWQWRGRPELPLQPLAALSPIARAAAAVPCSARRAAPANDERANAQPIRSLPAAINGTTVGATIESGERESLAASRRSARLVQPARVQCGAIASTWRRRRARRHGRRLSRGALAARFGRLPATEATARPRSRSRPQRTVSI